MTTLWRCEEQGCPRSALWEGYCAQHAYLRTAQVVEGLRQEVAKVAAERDAAVRRTEEDTRWMAAAMAAIEGLAATGPAFTGHPVVDVVATLRARLEAAWEADTRPCVCGHERRHHLQGAGECCVEVPGEPEDFCSCRRFVVREGQAA